MKIEHDIDIETGQKFIIDRFRPEDAEGIAHLFFAEYGAGYPFDTYYDPERIREENEKGNIHSVVARTPRGDIIGHGALYRSSPPHQGLYEIGQYIIRPNYRTTFAAYKINAFIAEELVAIVRPDGIFGEAVSHHVATQKTCALIGMKDVAIEIDLMPASAYEKARNASGRVSCLIAFRSFHDRPQEVFIPSVYQQEIAYILEDVGLKRTLTLSSEVWPKGIKTDVSAAYFSHAGVGRFNVAAVGSDFAVVAENLEKEGVRNGIVVFQYFLSLDKPWVGQAIESLREKGYFFGGYVPRWFDADAVLMQKIRTAPDFEAINLYSQKAKKLLDFIRSDWERTCL